MFVSISLDRVGVYTQALNTAFINAFEGIAEPAPIDKCITRVPSKGRVENYPWMFPPPLFKPWKGYRAYAKLGEGNYRVPNLTYSAEFEIMLEDLDDEQVPGWSRQAAQLAEGAKVYSGIQSLVTLAAGQTTACFDGSYFFQSSHTWGTGNNIVTGTAAATDGVTHAAVALVVSNKMVKPLLWQDREPAHFQTDMGSIESEKSRTVKNWATMRGAAAFGFWHDAILIKWSNTPTVQEIQTTLGTVNARFRSFIYPKNRPSDVNQYPHGQTRFSDANLVIVCSSLIEHIIRQALTLSLIAQTENYFKGFADLLCSGYLDNVT